MKAPPMSRSEDRRPFPHSLQAKMRFLLRETALHHGGFKVISVMTLIEARFEIEMGRCGTLLICYHLSEIEANEISRLFRRYCPCGRIIFVTESSRKKPVPAEADITLPESEGAELIVQALEGFAPAWKDGVN